MVIFNFLFCILLCFCVLNVESITTNKRNSYTGLPVKENKLTCERGTMEIQCDVGSTVYVVSATFGRIRVTNICARGGKLPPQEICWSSSALNATRATCYGKKECTIIATEENLGRALTMEGNSCEDTFKYLELEYECIPDCKPPRYSASVSVIGGQHQLGSTLTVKCRDGFMASANEAPISEITCSMNGSWTGGSIICEDIDECADDDLHRCDWHADCNNVNGGYSCVCGDGYYGDGFSCSAVNVDRTWMDPIKNASYNMETQSGCGGKFFETSGKLQSPNYPSLYPHVVNCQWVLSVPPSKVIEIEFVDFQLEEPVVNKGCINDFVTIYDGPHSSSRHWLATYCGKNKPQKVRSTVNQMRIEFKTNREASFAGFRAFYRSFDPLSICRNFIGNAYPGVVIMNGTRNETATAGDQVELGCEEGFNIMDGVPLVRTCQNDNTWDITSNPCEAVQCGEPMQFHERGLRLNGTSEKYPYQGKPLMYGCIQGFQLVSNPGVKTVITCNKEGRWSNEGDLEIPECRRIFCKITADMVPPQHTYWKVKDDKEGVTQAQVGVELSYGSSVEYSCAKGYALVGESERKCSGVNNIWSGSSVICEEDNGVPGLNNFQIAVITASVSGVLILIVGVSLLYCCLKEKKRKEHRIHRLNRSPKSSGNKFRSKFRYNEQVFHMPHLARNVQPTYSWAVAPHENKKSQRNSADPRTPLNMQQMYQKRPYMLPAVLKATPPTWSGPGSGLETPAYPQVSVPHPNPSSQYNANMQAYSYAQRPDNRFKDSYVDYQKKFKKK